MNVFILLLDKDFNSGNGLGIAEGGENEAVSFDFAPRRAKTNFYEINLKEKNE